MEIKDRIRFLLDMMSCCIGLSYWCFDENFSLIETTEQNEQAMSKLIFNRAEYNGSVLKHGRKQNMPLISSAQLGLEWASVFEKEDGELKRIHVLGPIFSSDITESYIEKLMNETYMPMKYRRKTITLLMALPVIPVTQFYPFVNMLHFCVTGEKISFADICHDALQAEPVSATEESSEGKKGKHAGIYAAELELLKMIEDGNLNYHSALNVAAFRASYSNLSNVGDPILKSKMVAATFITLSTRAAIRGGLPPSTAYSVGDYYEAIVANSSKVGEMANTLNTMYEDFVRRVRKCKDNPQVSKPIQSCCDYIDLHITEEIILKELAEEIGYTEYYLTRKFKKEMGVSIWDYTNQAKIERAKTMLTNPTLSIQDIGDALNYCSRSYFSEIFQKYVGMSPSEYRRVELKM